jgi:predicted ATP-grasp superfamily ATP-dependent carboligase
MWDALSIRCGIDIPYIAYCDALGWPVQAQQDYRENVIWVDMQRDIRAFVIYHRRRQLSIGGWLQSLRGEKDWAVYSRDDWKPALVATTKLLERPWSRVKRVFPFVDKTNT